MFRQMRRKNQSLELEECQELLKRGNSGVLSVGGDGGYPYGVPMSYVYFNSRLYFHCAKSGHKLDAVRKNSKASFCIIAQDDIMPEEYTTLFKSVIVFGNIKVMENEEEIMRAIDALGRKYVQDDSAVNRENAIKKDWEALCMLEMSVEHLSGKQSRALAEMRRKGL